MHNEEEKKENWEIEFDKFSLEEELNDGMSKRNDCQELTEEIKTFIRDLLASQREADRQRMVERVEKPSEIRTAKAASKEEDNFDFGYDVKTKEILSLLSNPKEE